MFLEKDHQSKRKIFYLILAFLSAFLNISQKLSSLDSCENSAGTKLHDNWSFAVVEKIFLQNFAVSQRIHVTVILCTLNPTFTLIIITNWVALSSIQYFALQFIIHCSMCTFKNGVLVYGSTNGTILNKSSHDSEKYVELFFYWTIERNYVKKLLHSKLHQCMSFTSIKSSRTLFGNWLDEMYWISHLHQLKTYCLICRDLLFQLDLQSLVFL